MPSMSSELLCSRHVVNITRLGQQSWICKRLGKAVLHSPVALRGAGLRCIPEHRLHGFQGAVHQLHRAGSQKGREMGVGQW